MPEVRRLLTATATTALLALGVASCGGGDDSTSGSAPQGEAAKPSARAGGGDFAPKRHEDSGGGSAQFRVEGGDNSVQEFGAEAGDEERARAATALHNFLDARAAEDWESACSFLSPDVRQSLQQLGARASQPEGAGCAATLAKLTSRAALPALRSEAARADVGSLRVEGDRAFVIYRGLGNTVLAMPMAKVDATWKVAAIGSTPLN